MYSENSMVLLLIVSETQQLVQFISTFLEFPFLPHVLFSLV